MFDKETQDKIIKLYKDNVSIDAIMEEFSSTERGIRRVLKDNQIDRQYNTFSQELYDRIVFLYIDKKYTQRHIQEELLIAEPVIRKEIKRRGLQMRSLSECNRRYNRNQQYFDSIDTPNKAYIIGLLYADGNNFSKYNAITIGLQEDDLSVLEAIKEELEYEGKITKVAYSEKHSTYKDCFKITINDEYMSKVLYEKGVVDNKSLVLKFPEWLDKTLYPYFIRGYFDGDGCVSCDQTRQHYEINICGTLDMMTHFQDIFLTMGIETQIRHPKQCGDNNTYTLVTRNQKMVYSLLSYIYQGIGIRMERKYQKYLDLCKIYGRKAA